MTADTNRLLYAAEEQLRSMRVSAALELFLLAERCGCDADACAAGRWECHMLQGDFLSAWRESDAIAARGNPDPHRYWDGQPLDGRNVLIRCLHGLGDTLQYIRYAPLIRQKAASLTVEAQPQLKALLAYNEVADRVITWGEPEPPWDQQIEIMEIPRIFRTDLSSVPAAVPYLKAPRTHESELLDNHGLLRTGIVWNSSQYNPARSVPVDLIASWFDIPGVAFSNLQAGPERFDLDRVSAGIPMLYREGGSILSTAADLNSLDLVITVDTMMAHLAGSLGKNVWTLLPYRCDWRWMLARADTPWYPTMRLFRQTTPGSWASLIEQVHRELTALAARPDSSRRLSKKSGLRV